MIAINYEEFKLETYNSVSLLFDDKEKKFNSGNFLRDWFDLDQFIQKEKIEEPISFSSTVGDFIIDGAEIDTALKCKVDGKTVLKYDTEDYNWFVPKGTKPTWDEFVKKVFQKDFETFVQTFQDPITLSVDEVYEAMNEDKNLHAIILVSKDGNVSWNTFNKRKSMTGFVPSSVENLIQFFIIQNTKDNAETIAKAIAGNVWESMSNI